ncbi:MAG: hypothetical protein WAM56_21465 [Acidobacteriaceae bacterium]
MERLGHPVERGLLNACYRERDKSPGREDEAVAATVTLFDNHLCRELGVSQERLRRARRYLQERGFLIAVPGKRGSGHCIYVLPHFRREL